MLFNSLLLHTAHMAGAAAVLAVTAAGKRLSGLLILHHTPDGKEARTANC